MMTEKIGILCAGDQELTPFLKEVEVNEIVEKAMLKFYEGDFCGFNVVILFCGACKVNAAIAVRTITDTAEHSGFTAFEENLNESSVITKEVTKALLQEIR